MRVQKTILHRIQKTEWGGRIVSNERYRAIVPVGWAAGLNLAYALYHGVLGLARHSIWFLASCVYYILLSAMRSAAVLGLRKGGVEKERALMWLTGVLFCVLSVVLIGIVYISLQEDVAMAYDEILMITIAAYTFAKISWVIVNAVRARKKRTPLSTIIQTIRMMEVAVSVLTMQRSMLVSFSDGTGVDAYTMNLITGAGVCLFALVLGVWMMRYSKRKGDDWDGQIEACKDE